MIDMTCVFYNSGALLVFAVENETTTMITSTENTTAPVSVFVHNTTLLKEKESLNNFTTLNLTVTLPNTTVVNTTSDGESGSFFILLDHLSVQVSTHFMQQNSAVGKKTVSQFICYAACFNQRTLQLVIFSPFLTNRIVYSTALGTSADQQLHYRRFSEDRFTIKHK